MGSLAPPGLKSIGTPCVSGSRLLRRLRGSRENARRGRGADCTGCTFVIVGGGSDRCRVAEPVAVGWRAKRDGRAYRGDSTGPCARDHASNQDPHLPTFAPALSVAAERSLRTLGVKFDYCMECKSPSGSIGRPSLIGEQAVGGARFYGTPGWPAAQQPRGSTARATLRPPGRGPGTVRPWIARRESMRSWRQCDCQRGAADRRPGLGTQREAGRVPTRTGKKCGFDGAVAPRPLSLTGIWEALRRSS